MGFKVTGKFKDCLTRQISEAVRIGTSRDTLLNSKGEYGGNTVSRLSVKEDDWDRRKRARCEDQQEEEDKRLVAEFRMRKLIQHNNTDASPTTAASATQYETDEEEFQCDADAEIDTEGSAVTTMMTALDQTTTMSNRPSMVPLVTLGQSNWSPSVPLVYTKGGHGGQDEHPWLKRVPEGVDESGGGVVGQGGDHRDDDEDVAIHYETDEDEFLDRSASSLEHDHVQRVGPVGAVNTVPLPRTSEQNRSDRRVDRMGYDLAYFNLWWSRMAIEGRKEAKETLRKEQEQAKTRRRLVKGRKRMTRGVEAAGNTLLVPASVSQMTEDLRGGTNLERGNCNGVLGGGHQCQMIG